MVRPLRVTPRPQVGVIFKVQLWLFSAQCPCATTVYHCPPGQQTQSWVEIQPCGLGATYP